MFYILSLQKHRFIAIQTLYSQFIVIDLVIPKMNYIFVWENCQFKNLKIIKLISALKLSQKLSPKDVLLSETKN